MKRTSIFALIILIAFSFILSGCTNDKAPTNDAPKNNAVIDIDTSKIIRVNIAGRIPISTDSIRDILVETSRFNFSEIPFENGVTDYHFSLDKNGDNSSARLFFSVLPEKSTEIISYNFSKAAVKGNQSEDIKWGLDLLLHILGTELTDGTWGDILDIVSKSGTVGALGKDYEGYKNEACSIRLVYADLGENVQIDIRT